MSYRDSLNSASTCVDSPVRTSFSTTTTDVAAAAAIGCISDLYAKYQTLQECDRKQRATEIGETFINLDKRHQLEKGVNDNASIFTGEWEEDEEDEQDEEELTLVDEGQESDMERETEMTAWLQEAIQMVAVLEGRLVELEEDCQSIPLYEQDRAQMIQVIQELEAVAQSDQAWIENAENVVEWTIFALEEALVSSGAKQGNSNNSNIPNSVTTVRPLEWKARSESTPPSLTIARVPTVNATVDTTNPIHDPSASEPGLVIYRKAIMTALRHLKTIERSQSTKSEITNVGDNNDDGSVKTRLSNPSLQKWLENAIMANLLSGKSEDQGSDTRGIAMEVDEDVTKTDFRDRDNGPCGNMRPLNQPRDHPLYPKGPTTESAQLQDHSQQPSPRAALGPSASAAPFQATTSGSFQSLQTNIGSCLMDESVSLKQHIQEIERLRVQEQERHQRAEQIHHQLVLDLTRFSQELLHSVSDLTCAWAALDEAKELTLMTFKSAESHTVDSTKRTKQMVSTTTLALTESMTMVEKGIKHMKTLAVDCVGITELAETQTQNQNTTTSIVADTADALLDRPASVSATPSLLPKAEIPNIIDPSASIASCSLPAPSSPLPALVSTLDQKPSLIFVDGIAYQEFEGHLASLRSALGSISRKLLNSSINNRGRNSLAPNGALIAATSDAALQTPSSLPQLLSSALSSTIEMTPFMKRVLAEDIYPCLLIDPKPAVPVKQNGWMSSLYSSKSNSSSAATSTAPATAISLETTNNNNNPSSTYNFNQQTPWLQRLLKAMERNSCEIEFWETNRKQRRDSTATASILTSEPVAAETAPKATCCLCGIVRPCEFNLRISDNEKHPLDRFCRDRIVAVCDFYTFLAHLRQGLLDYQSDLDLYRKTLWLRQRMGCARIGSIDVVQTCPTTPLLEAIACESR
ncbi:RAB3A interacting protein [Entomortierella chlamydospora]|uniref:RAB3A interacting protein n=1 Tax=Entomortierella chlamydospora TaxID=101097 RepID=A0A9P6T1R5_9FUNG|nr:RAB3A interacting protein [Entomortierella chlamydospora]KAG0018669.1 RAB3A interacting protein [Entomortierella chlamydospora]